MAIVKAKMIGGRMYLYFHSYSNAEAANKAAKRMQSCEAFTRIIKSSIGAYQLWIIPKTMGKVTKATTKADKVLVEMLNSNTKKRKGENK